MIVLGIDPGVASVGYGVIEYKSNKFKTLEYGTFKTPAGEALPHRLAEIYDFLKALTSKYPIDAMSVEQLFFTNNITTGIPVAQARGVILLAGEQCGLNIAEYTPVQVKQAVVGYGRAEKSQVQQMVRVLLGLTEVPRPDDTADALAIAICHAHTAGSLLSRL
jgi:crossover junction endodeoxyribonuclease RuvC